MIDIRFATQADIPALYALYDSIGKADNGYFERAFDIGAVPVIASGSGRLCGFCLLNRSPRYSLYRKLGIPEIQDLNVVPDMRRRGVAKSIVMYCEDRIRQQGGTMAGIAVGLTGDYGAAQIMYAKMGYLPDGNGVTYDREGVRKNATYAMDDDLALMLVKNI